MPRALSLLAALAAAPALAAPPNVVLIVADDLGWRDLVMDQGGADAFLPTSTLDRATMLRLKKRMVRRFYLRPSYLWRRLRAIASPWELGAQLREGLALLRRNV